MSAARLTEKIARDTGSLLTSAVWSRGLRAVVGLVVARVLGPSDFGLLKLISLVPTLSKFGSLGFDSVAQREIPHMRGGGQEEEEETVRSTAFTADFLWALILAAVVVAVSLAYERAEVRVGLWIAAGTLVASQITRLYTVAAAVDKRFSLVAQATAVAAFVEALVVAATVYWLRIYGVLLGALVGVTAGIFWYSRRERLRFTPRRFDWAEFRRQVGIAVPLAGATLGFGAFAWVERIEVTALFGTSGMGVYMLSVAFFELAYLITNTMLNAAGVHLYERLGRDADPRDSVGLIIKPTLVLAYLFPLGGALLWLLGPPIIRWALPDYLEVLPLLPWVMAMLTIRGISAVPLTVLTSARINRQVLVALLWVLAIGIFAAFTALGRDLGWGLVAPAVAKTAAFTAMTTASLVSMGAWFFASPAGLARFAARALIPLAATTVAVLSFQAVIPGTTVASAGLKALLLFLFYAPFLVHLERSTRVFSLLTGRGRDRRGG